MRLEFNQITGHVTFKPAYIKPDTTQKRPITNIWTMLWTKFFLQIGPKCLTIQEQVDPNEPFNERYVTFNHETYVTAIGDYYNDTVNIGASVELKCFYDPSMIYLYCIQNCKV